MDDEAGPAAEDRVELVFSLRRETDVPPFLEADELLVAEVPATRALIEVAADGSLIADLRRADLDCGMRDRRVQLGDLGVFGKVDELHRGANLQPAAGCRRYRRV